MPLKPIELFCDADFVTSLSIGNASSNPCFIKSPPKHPILGLCLQIYREKFDKNEPYTYDGYSITHTMAAVLASVTSLTPGLHKTLVGHIRLLEEIPPSALQIATSGGVMPHIRIVKDNLQVIQPHSPKYDPYSHRFKGSR